MTSEQRQMSPRMAQAIEILNRLFAGRRDCYGQLRRADKPEDDRGVCVKEPMTQAVWYDHLFGAIEPVGIYPIVMDGEDAVTSWFCIDIDRDGNYQAAKDIAARIIAAARPYVRLYPERSKGKGIHIWCFHEPVHAWKSRAVGRFLLRTAEVEEGQDKKGNEVIVFPKQDKIKAGEYGNFVYCPWWGPNVRAGRSAFLSLTTLEPLPAQVEEMATVRPMRAAQIHELCERESLTPGNVKVLPKTRETPPEDPAEPTEQPKAPRLRVAAGAGQMEALTDNEFQKLCGMLEALRVATGSPSSCPYPLWIAALIHMVPFADGYTRAHAFSAADTGRFNGEAFESYWKSAVRTYEKDHSVTPRKSQVIVDDWRHGGRWDVEPISDRYGYWKGCIVERMWKGHGDNRVEQHPMALTNFSARITHQESMDDGSGSTTRQVRIEGQLVGGRPLRSIEVSGKDWSEIRKWMAEKWGTDPIVWVDAGESRYAKVQEALALTGITAPNRHVYTHSGWIKVGGKMAFLTASGPVACSEETAREITEHSEVRLPVELARYAIPRQVTLADAMRGYDLMEQYLKCADHGSTAALLSTLFLAPLASMIDIDLIVGVVGKTGMRKSSLVAAILSGFSSSGFTRKNLPGSFKTTANYIEAIASHAKDLPFVVDNYKPDRKGEALATLERLCHSIGDGAARGRMRRDESTSQGKVFRGVMIITGEDLPEASSSVNRMYVINRTARDTLSLSALREVQLAAREGWLAPAMTHYLSWLADRITRDPGFPAEILKRYEDECLANAGEATDHGRLAEQTSWIKVGIDLARESHPVAGWHDKELYPSILRALKHESAVRRNLSNENALSYRFLTAMRTAIQTGLIAGVGRRTGFKPERYGPEFGWEDEPSVEGVKRHPRANDCIYIDAENVHSEEWSFSFQPDVLFHVLRENFKNSLPFLDGKHAIGNALESDGILIQGKDKTHRGEKYTLWDRRSFRAWRMNGRAAWRMLGIQED